MLGQDKVSSLVLTLTVLLSINDRIRMNFALSKSMEADSCVVIKCVADHSLFYKGQCITCIVFDGEVPTNCTSFPNEDTAIENPTTTALCPQNLLAFAVSKGAHYLDGRNLRIVTVLRPPFVEKTDCCYTGVIFQFLFTLQAKYNFSMEAFPPPDGNYGAKMANQTWNGALGMVMRKEADLGAGVFSVTYERAQVVDFTYPYHMEPTAILIPKPTEGEKLTVLVRPLSKPVWAAFQATVFIVLPSMYLMHQASKSIRGLPTTKGPSRMLSELTWFILASILQQSLKSPAEKTTRFITIIWWFVTLVIANVYLAFLVSFLSSPQLHNVVNSLEELGAQKKIKWTFRSNTAHRSLFMSETSTGTYKVIGDRTLEANLVSSDADGIDRVLNKHQAFIKEKSYLDVALGNDFDKVRRCRMTLAKETFFTVGIAMALQKESPFEELINNYISNTIATGIMDKWKQIHWPNNLWCQDAVGYIKSTQPKSRKLGVADLQGSFFLLGTGLLAAITSFILSQLHAVLVGRLHLRAYRSKFTNDWRFVR